MLNNVGLKRVMVQTRIVHAGLWLKTFFFKKNYDLRRGENKIRRLLPNKAML
jgi:hypothetical protein